MLEMLVLPVPSVLRSYPLAVLDERGLEGHHHRFHDHDSQDDNGTASHQHATLKAVHHACV